MKTVPSEKGTAC